MVYAQVEKAEFLSRPNRFIARCQWRGQTITVHVKNTGRCRELLVPGATVYLEHSENPSRKTAFSLIAVEKGPYLINMDSQAPNTVAYEAILGGSLPLPGMGPPTCLRREVRFGSSRFDLYAEDEMQQKAFIEVKGVTLEENGVVLFPDAPTQRGVKHVEELIEACRNGYRSYLLFVVQMHGIRYFTPNRKTHPEFADALVRAQEAGVSLLAYDCLVTENTLSVFHEIPIFLSQKEM